MAWSRRWFAMGVVGLSMGVLMGCARSLPDWAIPQNSLALDITDTQAPRVARLQVKESAPPVKLQTPLPGNDVPVIAPPPPLPVPGASSPVHQTRLNVRGTVRISVRAWVNGRPIFDDEVMQMAGPEIRRLSTLPETTQSEELAKTINSVVDQIINAELMYQEAVKTIEKNRPYMLDKLRGFVDQEYEKSVFRMRKANVPEAHIRELEPVARRMLERNLISTEYARSRILPIVQSRIGLQEIRDYYDAHKNEFQTVDKIVWHDIFIPVSPNLPTVNDVKRFAEEWLAKCRTPADFDRLMVYNEGDSKLRNGEGLGQRRGEIRPPELEAILFQLREGEIGPVIPYPTGVHLIRVEKRDYAGQLPLDDAAHKSIRRKLESQLADREYRRIIRELRSRAVVLIERDTP